MPAKKKKLTKDTCKKLPSQPKGVKPRAITLEKYKKAIVASGGFITKAAEILGVDHSAVSHYISKHPELQELRKSIDESYLDFAESQLITLIKEKDKAAIFFYLKCKGKDRGYIERFEHDVKTSADPVATLLNDVGKQVESNPDLKAKIDKELDDK